MCKFLKYLPVLFGLCEVFSSSASVLADDFVVRGISLDMRTQVMTMPALKKVVEKAAAEGINTLIMEYEATFPFDKHATICNTHRFSREEVVDFVTYCSELGVDVIPLQHCFGHAEYILQHDRYAALRENKSDMSQVCPLHIEEAKKVFGELFAEMAALHPSPYFHIGVDETRLLGSCKQCRQKMDEKGPAKLFVDYVIEMCNLVVSLGKRPVIWADMVLQHPESLHELPAETVIVDWNYGWKPTHFGNVNALVQAGFTVWGASSLRCAPDNIYLTTWDTHFKNLETFIPFAREHGYKGMINTSWSTSGRYGYIYDNGWEVMELQPMRQVYPMSGFDILQRAYADALKNRQWNAVDFIKTYGKEHFGFDSEGCQTLVDYMAMPQEKLAIAKTSKSQIDQMLSLNLAMQQRLAKLKPRYNSEDFSHLQLMLDIRVHYLKFKQVEKTIESETFDRAMCRSCADSLELIINEARMLSRRFNRLNKNYLKKSSESFGKWDYIVKMQKLHRSLTS